MTTKQDREWKFLSDATGMKAPFNDMYYQYLQSLGYTGTLQDMIAKSKFKLSPSTGDRFARTAAILGAGGLDYALYDSSALDRMWQESTGQTPAVLTSSIGLIIGREKQQAKTFAQVMAGQPEKVVSPWALSTGGGTASATESPVGTLNLGGDGTNQGVADQSFPTVIGKSYLIVASANLSFTYVRAGTTQGSQNLLPIVDVNAGPKMAVFVATSATTWVRFNRQAAGVSQITAISLKEVPAHYASQTVGGQRPVLQSDGMKFDGSDDNLLTDWFAQAGANCIIAQVTVPVAPASNQVIAGFSQAPGQEIWLSIEAASGKIRGDSVTATTHLDLRGTSAVVAIASDGATDLLFSNDSTPFSSPYVHNVAGTIACRFGGRNEPNNSSSFFFGGSIKRIAFGKVPLTLAQFQQIRAEWLAAA